MAVAKTPTRQTRFCSITRDGKIVGVSRPAPKRAHLNPVGGVGVDIEGSRGRGKRGGVVRDPCRGAKKGEGADRLIRGA